mmetsp:Transcript_13719/g.32497  ORF Transcript_13719/g.32497 Transcript_13719/m.32497 type:complete len:282 (+) Transcript_13719:1-846(+)
MLMIGETVLGLLTVPIEDEPVNYLLFGAGMVIATNLSFQHYATYPTNPAMHVMRASRLTYGGVAYLFSMLYVYSPALIMIGVGSKVLLKKVDYVEAQIDANWATAIGLASAFGCLNFFSSLHRQKNSEKLETNYRAHVIFFKVASTAVFIIVAAVNQLAGSTMVECCLVCVFQSCMLVYFAKHDAQHTVHDSDDHGHHAQPPGSNKPSKISPAQPPNASPPGTEIEIAAQPTKSDENATEVTQLEKRAVALEDELREVKERLAAARNTAMALFDAPGAGNT